MSFITRSFFASLLLFSLLTPQYTRPISVATALAWTGAACLGIAGTIAAASWFFTPSDQEVCDTTYTMVHNAEKLYGGYCEQIKHAYNIYDEKCDEDTAYAYLNEPLLYDIAMDLWYKQALVYYDAYSFSSYTKKLTSTVYSLKQQLKTIYERIEHLEEKHPFTHQDRRMLEQLQDAKRALKHCINRTSFVAHYFSYHESYFNLCTVEWTLFNQYKEELRLADLYRYDTYRLAHELMAFIRYQSSGAYPFIAYVHTLDKNIKNLETSRLNLTNHYKDRLAYVDSLIGSLISIRSALARAYEEDCREKRHDEKLRIERERARIAEERLYELRRYNKLHQQEMMLNDLCTMCNISTSCCACYCPANPDVKIEVHL
ncbi:MAG TPA: hypothetical protein VEK38_03820 [Candidatus Bathyarchaeia archaeon]|nr:hypothetical protein [Candidatus Bathyarchaeia archaeon]